MGTTPLQPDRTFAVRAPDGSSLHVRAYREDDNRQAVVLVHALAMDGLMWRRVIEQLPPALAVYAVDCRGHGLSDHPLGPYTIEGFAADLKSVVLALGGAPVHLVGCSMGGTASLAFAGLYPELLASLTVIDASACYGKEATAAWEKRAQQALDAGLESLIPFQVERWFSPAFVQAEPELVEAAKNTFLRNELGGYAATCRMLGIADTRPGLHRYAGPATIVVGEEDYATPVAMASEMAGLLANAKMTVIPKARHYTPIEVPREVAASIEQSIGRSQA